MNVFDAGRAGLRLISALVLFVLFSTAQAATAAAGTFGRGPAPGFIANADIPPANPKRLRQVDGGIYDLLYDTQVRVENGTQTTFRRRVYQLLDRSGLEKGAQFSIPFDPSYESVLVHRVAIIREGRVVDVSARSDLDALRQEKELEDGILDGMKTLLVRLPDVRVGDVIDISWSWVSRPPFWAGQYFGSFQLGWSTPVGLTRVRLDLPAGTPLAIYRYRGAPPAAFRRIAGRDLRQWISADPDPVVEDQDTPAWHRPWSRFAVTTMPEWRKIVDWALPLYATANQSSRELDDIAAPIERAGGSPEVKALKALRFVQDRIRYTSLSIGTGSYKPRSPETVVRSGWGDCKDKTLLLVVLLRRLGIEAWPALTDIGEGAALRREAPSPIAFDHVVAQVRIGAQTFWVDPTISHQGGTFRSLAPLRYGFALPIRPGQSKLEAIPFGRPTRPTMETVETYRFGANVIRLNVVTTYAATEADNARERFARRALAEREAKYLDYYADYLPGLRLHAPLAIEDDRNSNRLVTREAYVLPRESYDPELLDKFPVNASTLGEIYTYPLGGRKHPLTLAYPINRTHKIVVITPGMSTGPPEEIKIDGKAFAFELDTRRRGDTLTILFSLVGKTPVLEPKLFSGFRKDADALANNSEWTLAVTPGRAIDNGVALALGIALIASLVLFVAGIVHARTRKDSERVGEQYYPVPVGKFLLLGVATSNLYQAYWFWRQWRWVRRHDAPEISPFWRAFFGVFWLYPLFAQANQRAKAPLPIWLGAVAAILYFVWAVATSVAERIYDSTSVSTLVGLLGPLVTLPALIAVNRSNTPDSIGANGTWGWLALATVPVGLGTMALLAFAT